MCSCHRLGLWISQNCQVLVNLHLTMPLKRDVGVEGGRGPERVQRTHGTSTRQVVTCMASKDSVVLSGSQFVAVAVAAAPAGVVTKA